MVQWIRLVAHGQWGVGANPIRAIGGVRKASNHNCSCAPKTNQSLDPLRKKPNQGFSQGVETLNGRKYCEEARIM